MRHLWLVGAATLLVAATAEVAEAQRTRCWRMRGGRVERCEAEHDRERARRRAPAAPVEMGIRGGYDFEAEAGTFGGHLRVPVAGPLTLVPSLDVALDDASSPWQANADLVLRPPALAGVYAGLGAAFARLEDGLGDRDTEVGLNVVAGLDGGRIGRTRLRPFAEGRWTRIDEDRDTFRLAAGFNVAVSGR